MTHRTEEVIQTTLDMVLLLAISSPVIALLSATIYLNLKGFF